MRNYLFILFVLLGYNGYCQSNAICSYETDGTGKSKQIKIKLSYPCDWEAKEGERPNIVQKFSSGGKSIMLLIKMVPDEVPNNQLKILLEPSTIREGLEDYNVISVRKTIIDGLQAIEAIYDADTERPIGNMYQKMCQYTFLYKRYYINIVYGIAGMSADKASIKKDFDETLKGFQALSMKTVVLSQYK